MYWHESFIYKTMCILSLCYLCFALYISKCIQISRSTAVSSYYTAAPRSLPSSLSLSCISPVTHLTSKVFLGNTLFPSFQHEKTWISIFFPFSPVSIPCCHRSSCKMFLSGSFVLCSYCSKATFLIFGHPAPPLHVIWSVLHISLWSKLSIWSHPHLNVQHTWWWGVTVSPSLPSAPSF